MNNTPEDYFNVTATLPASSSNAEAVPLTTAVFLRLAVAMGVIGATINGSLIVALIRFRRNKANSPMILSAETANFFCSITVAITYAVKAWVPSATGWLGQMQCKWMATNLLYAIGKRTATGGMIIITAERYVMIVHPIFHRKHNRPWMVGVAVAFQWLYGFLSTFPPLYPDLDINAQGHCVLSGLWARPRFYAGYGWYTIIWNYTLPLTFFAYCYGRILAVITRGKVGAGAQEKGAAASGAAPGDQAGVNRVQLKIIKAMILVVGFFGVCDFLIQVYCVMQYILALNLGSDSVLLAIAIFVANLDLCIDPIVYALQLDSLKGARRVVAQCLRGGRGGGVAEGGQEGASNTTNTEVGNN